MGLDKVDPTAVEITPWLGLGRFAPFQMERNVHETKIRLFWQRIIAWLFLMTLVGWVLLATGAFFFVKYQRDYTAVHYSHLVFFPWQKDEYRKAKCEFLIAKGKAEFNEKRYLEAFYNMRLGLQEVPGDTEARLNLVRLYNSVNRYDLAEKLMLEGVEYNIGNFDYVVSVFQLMFAHQRDDEIIQESRKLLKLPSLKPDVRNMLIMGQASAHFFRGRNDDAERVLQIYAATNDRIGGLVLAQIAWERNEKESALTQLTKLGQRYPLAHEIYNQQIAYLRSLNRFTELKRVSVLRQLEHPGHPRAYIDELSVLSPDTEPAEWTEAVEAVFNRFPSEALAMEGLAEVAVGAARPELAERAYRQCQTVKLPWQKAATAIIEANLVGRRYADALKSALQVLAENEEWARTRGGELNGLRSVANYALGDTALSDLQLKSYLEELPPQSQNLIAVAEYFLQTGAFDHARKVLVQAVSRNEFDQAALTRLLEIEGTIDTHSIVNGERLLTMRKPSSLVLARLRSHLQSDHYLLLPGRCTLMNHLGDFFSSAGHQG